MRNNNACLAYILSAGFLFAISSCAPTPETTAPPLETYSIQAQTGDSYSFHVLPLDPNEFRDGATLRISRAKVMEISADGTCPSCKLNEVGFATLRLISGKRISFNSYSFIQVKRRA
jgi:hypothetical protein